MKLSKTNYLIYRDCPHNAWVKIHAPAIYHATPLSAFDESIIETGNVVDERARDLFPGGILIARGDAATTRDHIVARTPVLYQPVFETDRYTTACDILVWNPATSRYDLYEVKSSTNGNDKKAKDKLYSYDLAFQAEVLRANGVPLGRLMLVRLDGDYVLGDSLDVSALFTREDFSERVTALSAEVSLEMATAHEILSRTSPLVPPCGCMTKGRSAHCTTFAYTNPQVPEYSVHDIARIGLSKRKLAELVDHGILKLEDVPDTFELSEAQANQVRAAKTGRPSIDHGAIEAFLTTITYPVAFLDYETYPCAVPRHAGYSPYDHIPFQFSLDVVPHEGADLVHHEFLHTEPSAPDDPLIDALRAAMPSSGSVVTWNKKFEKGINDRLAARNPGARSFLADVNARVVDLMDVFAEQAYVHPGFKGRTSIKAILPVLVPELSYADLPIREGATATVRWNEVVIGQVDAATASTIRNDLLRYCALDTRAMVEIWRVLTRL
ncbi:MAG: DUF2779 domain-containing protein [Vicinamibacterales bacterium]